MDGYRKQTFSLHKKVDADWAAQLCSEALGPLAPSLAWGCGWRVQAAHILCLVAVGVYAAALPRICPQWLQDNIVAEAARVGNSTEKHKAVFDTAVIVLSILDGLCLAMIAMACQVIRNKDIRQLVADVWKAEKAYAQAVAVVRRSYAISMCGLGSVIGIYTAISCFADNMPNRKLFILGWCPAFFPMWVLLQLGVFLRLMASLSLNDVEAYYSELEDLGANCCRADEFPGQMEAAATAENGYTWEGRWLQLLRKHQALLHNLKLMSRALCMTVLLFQNMIAGASLLLLWVARACRHAPLSSCGYVLLAFVLANSGLVAMLPLTATTELCRSKKLGRRSLLAVADKYAGWPMSASVHAEYMRFMQHLHTTEAGIYIPTMGLVTRASLIQRIMFYVKVLPLALAFTLGWWRRG